MLFWQLAWISYLPISNKATASPSPGVLKELCGVREGKELLAKLHLLAVTNREGNRGLRTRSDGMRVLFQSKVHDWEVSAKVCKVHTVERARRKEEKSINWRRGRAAPFLVGGSRCVFVVGSWLLLSSGEAGANHLFIPVLERVLETFLPQTLLDDSHLV